MFVYALYWVVWSSGSRFARFDPTAYKAEKDRQKKEIELKRFVILLCFLLCYCAFKYFCGQWNPNSIMKFFNVYMRNVGLSVSPYPALPTSTHITFIHSYSCNECWQNTTLNIEHFVSVLQMTLSVITFRVTTLSVWNSLSSVLICQASLHFWSVLWNQTVWHYLQWTWSLCVVSATECNIFVCNTWRYRFVLIDWLKQNA